MDFKTREELMTFLSELQGQMANLQETVDKLSPLEEGTPEEKPEETPEATDEEISEIDSMLQED